MKLETLRADIQAVATSKVREKIALGQGREGGLLFILYLLVILNFAHA